ncbi:MAG: OB-fold nucleic acid binding domain-containing protein [Candidatus Riflebacteria bacterium]|nr:OB-fold nucleic acid binding domain-containing protein [Candidatus Riflebacteria bacterium]
MKENQIEIRLEDERGLISAKKFIIALETMISLVEEVDKNFNGKKTLELKIANLQIGSAISTLEAVSISPKTNFSTSKIVSCVLNGIRDIESGTSDIPDHFSEAILKKLRKLASFTDKYVKIKLNSGMLSHRAVATIDNWTTSVYTETDSIEGTLEAISIRNKKKFHIFTDSEEQVQCFFSEDLFAKVKMALGERVCIHGETRKTLAGKPTSMHISDIEILHTSKDIDLNKFVGAWNLPMKGEEYIRMIRDEE